jgi:hypothetical protein
MWPNRGDIGSQREEGTIRRNYESVSGSLVLLHSYFSVLTFSKILCLAGESFSGSVRQRH